MPSETPTLDQIRRFNSRINRLIAEAATAEDEALRRIRDELVAAQRDARLIVVSSQTTAAQVARIQQRLGALDEVLTIISDDAIAAAATHGAGIVDQALDHVGLLGGLEASDLSGLIDDKSSFARALINDRVANLQDRMVAQLQALAADPDALTRVLADIAEDLHGSVVFGAAARDTTSMVATAVGDTHGAAMLHRGVDVARSGGPVTLKRWISSHRKGARSAHLRLEAATIAGIPLDEPFRLGKHTTQRPRGPGLPGAERISCRCRLGMVLTDDSNPSGELDGDTPADDRGRSPEPDTATGSNGDGGEPVDPGSLGYAGDDDDDPIARVDQFDAHFAEWASNLTGPELAALEEYQAAGGLHADINAFLRGDYDDLDDEVIDMIAALDSAIAKGRTPDTITITWRGQPVEEPFDLDGDIDVLGLLSTSIIESIARGFTGDNEGGVIVRLVVPGGTPAAWLPLVGNPDLAHEAELLLGASTRVRIVSAVTRDGILEINAEVLP